ncbi:MAG: Rieske 2Fe-2S domain-containing protein [Planctomycetales bacterium]|nr:Rieske 2Fe-2S domain-containing protein [Planctomycetales bacterium]
MSHPHLQSLLDQFDPTLEIEQSLTPPGSWYVDPEFFEFERRQVFQRCWIAAGRTDQVQLPGDYFTGDLVGNPYVVVRGDEQTLYGHHNVCRHKGAVVASQEDESRHRCDHFQCPYHGWEYRLDGSLKKAPLLGPQASFRPERNGLSPLSVDTWGPLVFVDLDGSLAGTHNPRNLQDDVSPLATPLEELGFSKLRFYKRLTYDMACNWKVFVDNSLDGGYHVKYAHAGLAQGLEMDEFETHIFNRSSLQVCRTTGGDSRLGERVMYAYLFPNLFINRYGNVMDVNIVLPLAVDRCRVIFDFYFDVENLDAWDAKQAMRKSVNASHGIQQEDVEICESAQRGMQSMAWKAGRYSSILEKAVHAFHGLLWRQLSGVAD